MIRRKDYCPGCGKLMNLGSKKCYRCKRKGSTKIDGNSLVRDFVIKIESRGGWCSIEELLVELITLNNEYGHEYMDSYKEPHEQLMSMYNNLKQKITL